MSEESKTDLQLVAKKRNLPGTPATETFSWIGEVTSDSDSQFAAQEYIQRLVRANPADVVTICTLPPHQDKNVWIMEHLRIFLSQLNYLASLLDEECTRETCPIMIATKDWEFLCAAHPKPGKCCAIDYIVHTISGFTSLLNGDDFPSRVVLSPKGVKHFSSIARRMYRLFAHPYYHHRDTFDRFETETHLCRRFLHFVTAYGLMQRDHFTPPITLSAAAAS